MSFSCRLAAATGTALMTFPGGHEELGAPNQAGFMARVEDFGGRQMGLQWDRSVQPLSGPQAVTRSHPSPKSRSYEALFFFSSPAWSLLYSFLFQANAPAVKETCIPLYNLRQAWPGCSSSIKQSFSCLPFPVPWHPNWRSWVWDMGAFGVVHWQRN